MIVIKQICKHLSVREGLPASLSASVIMLIHMVLVGKSSSSVRAALHHRFGDYLHELKDWPGTASSAKL
eukprot:6206653-Karenia_brevis.AAC.1